MPQRGSVCQNVAGVRGVLDACLHLSLIGRGSPRGCDLGLRVHWQGWGGGSPTPHRLTSSLATSICTESGVHCVYDSEGEKPAAVLV